MAHRNLPHTLVAREKYAWPGGYALFAVMSDGEAVCSTCVRSEYRQIAWATRVNDRGGWACIGFDHTGNSDEPETCAHCGTLIV